jgi:hypothetical protein
MKYHKQEADGLELTWIDALYFGSVTATSIGYGDITAQSDGAKIFLCFYMLISTLWMADCLGNFIDLYVNDVVGEVYSVKLKLLFTFFAVCLCVFLFFNQVYFLFFL